MALYSPQAGGTSVQKGPSPLVLVVENNLSSEQITVLWLPRPACGTVALDHHRGSTVEWAEDTKGTRGDRVENESAGHGQRNPRLYALIENSPKTGPSPTMWAWPQLIDHLKVASQPVQGPWPPDQEPRPEPGAESLPVAIADPHQPNDET
jgi:hypothetical protein